jgi:hypothetical protein
MMMEGKLRLFCDSDLLIDLFGGNNLDLLRSRSFILLFIFGLDMDCAQIHELHSWPAKPRCFHHDCKKNTIKIMDSKNDDGNPG